MKTHLDGCERFRIQSAQSIQSQTKNFSYFLSPGLSKTLSLGFSRVAHSYFLSIKGKLLWALGRSSHPHFLSCEGHSLLWLSDQVPHKPLLAENRDSLPAERRGAGEGRAWASVTPTIPGPPSLPRASPETTKRARSESAGGQLPHLFISLLGAPLDRQSLHSLQQRVNPSLVYSGFYQILISSCQEVSLPLCQVHVSFCRGKMAQVPLFHTRAGVSGSAFPFSRAQSPDRRSWRCRAMCNNPG